jgi:hypothetical protein
MTSSSNASPSASNGEPVHVIACGAIARHVDDVARRRGWSLVIHPLPPLLHNAPKEIAGAVEAEILALQGDSARIIVAYADCGTYGALDAIIERHGVGRLRGEHCYDVFAGASEIASLLAEQPGTYFFTDYLVKSFRRSVVIELGLDRHPELRDDYFRHYTRVLWLAQEPTADLQTAAVDAADLMGLPLDVLQVGDLGLEAQLEILLR